MIVVYEFVFFILLMVILGMVVFLVVVFCIYLVNDLLDLEVDCLYFKKCKCLFVVGIVMIKVGMLICLVFGVIVVGIGVLFGFVFLGVVVVYMLLLLVYLLKLK